MIVSGRAPYALANATVPQSRALSGLPRRWRRVSCPRRCRLRWPAHSWPRRRSRRRARRSNDKAGMSSRRAPEPASERASRRAPRASPQLADRVPRRRRNLVLTRIAIGAIGKMSATTSDMNLRVRCSMPLAQITSGVPSFNFGNAVTASRSDCAGTAIRIASASANADRICRRAPRRLPGGRRATADFRAVCAMAFADFSLRATSVTLRPARATAFARAVPQAPAPAMATRSTFTGAIPLSGRMPQS